MKARFIFATAFCCHLLGGSRMGGGVFEQVADGPRGAWRSWGTTAQILILPSGFILQQGHSIQRFRWDRSMNLEKLKPEQEVPSRSYLLAAPDGGHVLAHAQRVRASRADGKVSVEYYFGARGLEFDIEVGPGVSLPRLRLLSADQDFTIRREDQSATSGGAVWHKPIAKEINIDGSERFVSATYRLHGRRTLIFDIAGHRAKQRLVIDPVVTYATYLAGTGDESPLAIREMPGGDVLLAGNTSSIDLPEGFSLNTLLMDPAPATASNRCFVARLSTATKQIRFVSYLGDSSSCSDMDVDSSGRILLVGESNSPRLTTSDAQFPTVTTNANAFLARVTVDGRTLDYSSYVSLDCTVSGATAFLRAGPAQTVYIGTSCGGSSVGSIPGGYQQTAASILLLRYDIAAKRFDQKTYFGDNSGILRGMTLTPSGSISIFGETPSHSLPLQSPVQSAPPVDGWYAGFVANVSSDFRSLLFSTYLGGQSDTIGQGSNTSIRSVTANPDGSFWLTGLAANGSIPNLPPARPFTDSSNSPFAVQVTPGNSTFNKAFLTGGYGLGGSDIVSGVTLTDGRFCIASYGDPALATPGGAAVGTGDMVPLLGCLNDAGNDFEMITATGSFAQSNQPVLILPSQQGGIWSLQLDGRGGFGDVVPYEFKAAAIQPNKPPVDSDDLVLRYIDLSVQKPSLINPQPVSLYALASNFTDSVFFGGQNFASGMQLVIGNTLIPLTVTTPSMAALNYNSPTLSILGTVVSIPAGTYPGKLVIPAQPPVESDPFTVNIKNLPPTLQPFIPTTNPLIFGIAGPLYNDSQATWNGQPIAITSTSTGAQVQLSPVIAPSGTGEFALRNQPPGGGVQRETVSIGAINPIIGPTDSSPTISIPATAYQIDRTKRILYTITSSGSQWKICSYSLPDGAALQSLSIPQNGSSLAVDFKLSLDGTLLYMTDDLLRVIRLRTDVLAIDLQFQVPTDAAPPFSSPQNQHSLRVLDDAPQSVLFVTPAGRMVLYDNDQPRPYTTVDFPSPAITVMDPVLATNSYVYALQRASAAVQPPCLTRYPVDGLGFNPPEDFCTLGSDWGKYPEMKVYSGTLVLESAGGSYGIRQHPIVPLGMRLPSYYATPQGLVTNPFNLGLNVYRLEFNRLDTDEAIGHYPPESAFATLPTLVTFLDNNTMLFAQQPPGTTGSVVIVPNWSSAIQLYQ